MPPPTTKCVICNQEVLKAQTLHIGDGKRACKCHSDVVAKAQNIQAQAKAEEKRKQDRIAQKKRERWENSSSNPNFMENVRKWAWEQCWCCGKEGRQLRDFYERMVIGLEKSKIKGNPLDFLTNPQRFVKELGFPVPTIFIRRFDLPVDPGARERVLRDIKGGMEKRQSAELGRMVQLCEECAKRHGFEFFPHPKVDLPTLAMLGSMIPPVVTEIAKQEVEADVEKAWTNVTDPGVPNEAKDAGNG